MIPRIFLYVKGEESAYSKNRLELNERTMALLRNPITQFCCRSERHTSEYVPIQWLTKQEVLQAVGYLIQQQLYYNKCAAVCKRLEGSDEETLKSMVKDYRRVMRLPSGGRYANAEFWDCKQNIDKCDMAIAAGMIHKFKRFGDATCYKIGNNVVVKLQFSYIALLATIVPAIPARPRVQKMHITKSDKVVLTFA